MNVDKIHSFFVDAGYLYQRLTVERFCCHTCTAPHVAFLLVQWGQNDWEVEHPFVHLRSKEDFDILRTKWGLKLRDTGDYTVDRFIGVSELSNTEYIHF